MYLFYLFLMLSSSNHTRKDELKPHQNLSFLSPILHHGSKNFKSDLFWNLQSSTSVLITRWECYYWHSGSIQILFQANDKTSSFGSLLIWGMTKCCATWALWAFSIGGNHNFMIECFDCLLFKKFYLALSPDCWYSCIDCFSVCQVVDDRMFSSRNEFR